MIDNNTSAIVGNVLRKEGHKVAAFIKEKAIPWQKVKNSVDICVRVKTNEWNLACKAKNLLAEMFMQKGTVTIRKADLLFMFKRGYEGYFSFGSNIKSIKCNSLGRKRLKDVKYLAVNFKGNNLREIDSIINSIEKEMETGKNIFIGYCYNKRTSAVLFGI